MLPHPLIFSCDAHSPKEGAWPQELTTGSAPIGIRRMKMVIAALVILMISVILLVYLVVRYERGKQKADAAWLEGVVNKIRDFGTTESLEVVPIIDWYAERESLKTEPGVSYLVKTDNNIILFDVGLNFRQDEPSPLLHNMNRLGVNIDDIDSIVISHNHADHVGGMKWARQKTFSLGNEQIDLKGKNAYTPVPMSYPGITPGCSQNPTVIGTGVATIGTIPRQLFFLGWTQEQALAVHVRRKGIVLIVGCGHQTLPKIIQRAEALFDEPIYGIIGGFHYPVTESRAKVAGINLQKYIGTGKPPWDPITMDEVQTNIEILSKRDPKMIALSAHDSCDAVLDRFRDAFGNVCQELKVGKRILIGES